MLRFIFRRFLFSIPVYAAVIVITFLMIHAAPGGPFDQDRKVRPEILKKMNDTFHLNDPVWTQLGYYLKNLLHGDFGPSYKFATHDVNDFLSIGIPVTAELGFYSLLVALTIGLLAGIFASLKPNSIRDYSVMSLAMVGISLPTFVLGPCLVLVFGIYLGWLPVAGWGQIPGDKILPSITLGAAYAAYIARISRGSMLEVLSQDYIRTAKAKGLPQWRIVFVHALRGALTPVVSFLGPAIAGLLAGSFVVETIFQIPGLGRFYVQAAFNRDYTMIMGFTIFFATLIVVFNLLSDVILVWLNPKLRHEYTGGQ